MIGQLNNILSARPGRWPAGAKTDLRRDRAIAAAECLDVAMTAATELEDTP